MTLFYWLLLASSTIALAACGESDSEDEEVGTITGTRSSGGGSGGGDSGGGGSGSGSGGSGSGNAAPTITGTPSPQVAADSGYQFTPVATDPDGDALTFTIENKPAWAAFSGTTGTLSGTPGQGDVGSYPNIRIAVTDGTASASLATFSISVVAVGNGSATLTWSPPTLNTDGSALTDLEGYRVYWGPSAGNYTNSLRIDPGLSSFTVSGLTVGTWFFAATAFNSRGIESTFSNVASKTIE